MVEIKKLKVEKREESGKRRNRRLRASGRIPAVLYGHKQENVNLSVAVADVEAVLRHGSRFVELLQDDKTQRVFIKECQWDTWGKEILHVDFTRVSEHEHVQLTVPLELRGEAPGVKDGGVIKQVLHEVLIECEPIYAPEKIGVKLNNLGFKEMIHLKDITMPEGVKVLTDIATVVVECVEPVQEEEAPEVAPTGEAGTEPEVIGRKKSEDEAEAE
ncbi:MAG: 50S ribosomal protein L25 [Thermoguttaceae bacterium]|nr:50S ribosomal protein L25 [Thermoguttaceae bacterium]